MNTTLNEIKKHNPCSDSWQKGLKFLGKHKADNRKLSFKRILKAVGIIDAVWALRVLPYEDKCLFMADVAESVLHIFENKYPNDHSIRKAIQAVRDYSSKKITKEPLGVARSAADGAADAANVAADVAAGAAARAAAHAADAAYTADAASSAGAAAHAAYVAGAARKEKWAEIEALFVKHFC